MLAQEINGRGRLKGHANTSFHDNTSYHFRGTCFELLRLSEPALTRITNDFYLKLMRTKLGLRGREGDGVL